MSCVSSGIVGCQVNKLQMSGGSMFAHGSLEPTALSVDGESVCIARPFG